MGNECCQKDQSYNNLKASDFNIDEFYDPYSELKARVVADPNAMQKHGPKYINPLPELPRHLVKLESVINQNVTPPKVNFYPDAVVLPPYELYKDCYYFGQWSQGQKHGYGKIYFPDKSAYSGEFNFGKAQGKGRLFHPNGDIYIGDWRNDKAHGYGKYVSGNRAVFEGSW